MIVKPMRRYIKIGLGAAAMALFLATAVTGFVLDIIFVASGLALIGAALKV